MKVSGAFVTFCGILKISEKPSGPGTSVAHPHFAFALSWRISTIHMPDPDGRHGRDKRGKFAI